MLIVVCIIAHASVPAYCGEEEEREEQVENYEEYLLAMEIPPAVVMHIKMIKWVK